MKLQQYMAVFVSFFLVFLSQSYATSIDKIIVFGDSLSDNGNVFALTKAAHAAFPHFLVLPKDPPYFNGRFTNGRVWIEDLADAMNVPLVDYAYGGAWAESVVESKQIIPFDLGMQVNFYLLSSAIDFHKDKHLYAIWVGSNDYIKGRDNPEYATTNTVHAIHRQIEWLIYAGARNFLLLNIPDLGHVPEALVKGVEFSRKLSHISELHNAKFAEMIKLLREQYPDVNFVAIDITQHFKDMIDSNARTIKVKNVNNACYDGGYTLRNDFTTNSELAAFKEARIDVLDNPMLRVVYLNSKSASFGAKQCQNPDDYLFWDLIHPTSIAHMSISLLSLYSLNDVGITGSV